MLSKKVVIPALAVVLVAGLGLGINQTVHAQTANKAPFSGLVTAIAQKFGLDQGAVQAVATQYRQQQKQNFQANIQQREKKVLDAEVTAGKINATQEQAILTELASLDAKYSPASMKGETASARKQTLQNRQTDLSTWAQSQGIDPSVIPGFGGMGMRGRGRAWVKPSASPSSSPTT